MKLLFYIVIVVAVVALVKKIFEHRQSSSLNQGGTKFRFRSKPDSQHAWVQVYDTDSLEEIRSIQACLEEEEVECFVYEQGRKDMHGNQLKGYGIAVPRTSLALAQKIIARMPA